MEIGTSLEDFVRAQLFEMIEKHPWQFQSQKESNVNSNLSLDIYSRDIPIQSTRQSVVNQQNLEFLEMLRSKENLYVTYLHRCGFEDGIKNDAIAFVEKFLKENESVTCNWLNEVYGRHLKDNLVLCGILRTVSFLHIKNYDYTFVPMIKASLSGGSIECQEAALMLIETIRNRACLEAIETTDFENDLVKEYAAGVANELRKELSINVAKEN